ncbi:hypothetical protein L5515_010343 [Caenorhabditis briggsae]|uniref:Uncharacterized protein n=2 Tax=Caenorhabditis briggsae TaxID=6238 RepID=A0AAE9EPZ2_CAEBR|nr:hypothetical protein L5515_010343 [Caenorhabditis briggsae]
MSNLHRTNENPSENPLKENQNPEESATTKIKNSRRILSLFFQKRKAVLDAYLAGEISFENLPCQMKILEADYRKYPHLTSYNQVEGLGKAAEMNEKMIFDYFKMRRTMDKNMKLRDASEDPSGVVQSPELKDPAPPVPSQVPSPYFGVRLVTQQELKNPALSLPATKVIHCQQTHGSQNSKDVAPKNEENEFQNNQTIFPRGAYFLSPHNWQKLLIQHQEACAAFHAHVAQKQSVNASVDYPRHASKPPHLLSSIISEEMDYPISPMTPAPEDSVQAQNEQITCSEKDVRSQMRLLQDLCRQIRMPAAQEARRAHVAVTPSIQVSNKRKYSPSLDALTDKPTVSSLIAKRTNHGLLVAPATCLPHVMLNKNLCPSSEAEVNELVAPTPEQEAQRRQERMNLYNGWFQDTYLPYNHSINYEDWTSQQVQEFAIQFLPLDAILTLMKEKVDGSNMEMIRCGDTGLLGQLYAGSNGQFVLEHWNLIKDNIEVIWLYRKGNEEK